MNKEDYVSAFVAGAMWWEWEKEGATMWQSDQTRAANEAEQRWGRSQAIVEIASKIGIIGK